MTRGESPTETPTELVSRWSVWELLAFKYLDTDMPDFEQASVAELDSRQISPIRLAWMRFVTAGGLWWNVLWWEWCTLDGTDIAYGWILNLSLAISIVIGIMFGLLAGIGSLVGLTLLSALLMRLGARQHPSG